LHYSKVAKNERLKNKSEKNKVQPIEISVLKSNDENEKEEETKAPLVNSIEQAKKDRNEKILLYTMTILIAFLCYGTLPGLQSYSTLPYGNNVFNLAVNLSN
jgi:hypothetical protein